MIHRQETLNLLYGIKYRIIRIILTVLQKTTLYYIYSRRCKLRYNFMDCLLPECKVIYITAITQRTIKYFSVTHYD